MSTIIWLISCPLGAKVGAWATVRGFFRKQHQRGAVTHNFLPTEAFTRMILTEAFCSDVFTQRSVFHGEVLTHRRHTQNSFYTRMILHPEFVTRRNFFTCGSFHTHRGCYTEKLLHYPEDVYMQKFLHREVFYTEQLLHRGVFTDRRV